MKRLTALFATVTLGGAFGIAACNNSKLVAGASCTPAATSGPASLAPIRPEVAPYVASNYAAATAVTGNALLTAMDADPATFTGITLTGNAKQFAVFSGLGTLHPSAGSTFAWVSTGVAGAGTPSSLDPIAFITQPGTDFSGAGCGTATHDCAQFSFSFVVPAGLHSVAFDFNFMSTEYPEFVGLGFNDSFTVSMTSPSHTFPNLVFDHNNHPINIDSVLFTQTCQQLTGTGFDLGAAINICDAGATGLLTTTAPVEPGETVQLTFKITDVTDGIYDSAVMLDNLRITPEPVGTPNTGTPTPTATQTPTPTPDSCPA